MSAHAHEHENTPAVDVVRVSAKNKKVRTIRVGRPTPQAAYIIPTLKGLRVTLKHFFRNVITKSDVMTVQYPEEKEPYPERHRGLHRLMKRENGSVRCVACMMCPTVCPANCITIIPEESEDPTIEKRPAVFEIDELRCVVCGMCVEACPCDAIRMDTGVHAPPVEERFQAVHDKEKLMSRGEKSTAIQGGAGPDWRDRQ